MKIVEFELIPVYVNLRRSYRSSRVQEGVGIRSIIVRLVTNTGLIGWGESCGLADPKSIADALVAMRPFVIGRDPWDTEAIAHDVYRRGLWDYRFLLATLRSPVWTWRSGICAARIAANRSTSFSAGRSVMRSTTSSSSHPARWTRSPSSAGRAWRKATPAIT